MKRIYAYSLILGVAAGQLVKFPVQALAVGTLLDLVVGLLCLSGLLELKFKLASPPIQIKLALGFLGIGYLSLVLTPLNLNITQYLVSLSYAVRFGLFVLLGWIVYSGGLGQIGKYVQEIFITSGGLLALGGLLQLIFIPDLGFLQSLGWDPHFFRAVSTLLDPNFLGVFLGCSLLVIVFYPGQVLIPGCNFPKSVVNRLKIGLFVVVFLADVATFSRSALLMFSISFLAASFLKRSLKLGVLTIFLILVFVAAYFGYNRVIAEVRHVNRTQSAELRVSSWHIGLELIRRYPVLGVGFNGYRFGLEQNHLAPEYYVQGHGGSSNDSSLIFVAATTGIAGLILYLMWFGSLVWPEFNSKRMKAVVVAGMAGLLVNSLFINSLFYPWILLWLILLSCQINEKSVR